MRYWRSFPPPHVSLARIVAGLGLSTRAGRAQATGGASADASTSAMEAVATLLGPPQHRYRPPCRMQGPPDPTPEAP